MVRCLHACIICIIYTVLAWYVACMYASSRKVRCLHACIISHGTLLACVHHRHARQDPISSALIRGYMSRCEGRDLIRSYLMPCNAGSRRCTRTAPAGFCKAYESWCLSLREAGMPRRSSTPCRSSFKKQNKTKLTSNGKKEISPYQSHKAYVNQSITQGL